MTTVQGVLSTTSAFLIISLCVFVEAEDTDFCTEDSCTSTQPQKGLKTILLWTPFYAHRNYTFGLGQKPFIDAKCQVDSCQTFLDRSQQLTADAVVFHMRNVNQNTALPTLRKPTQRYVFFLMENPYHQWNDLRLWKGYFNLTMTYRKDSDVPILYGRTQKIAENHEGKISWKTPTIGVGRQKRKLVAWFASNCKSHSRREEYVKELKKYIPIDIYGKCGKLKCPKEDSIIEKHNCDECYSMLEENYKFYLSFENIHCLDYVTEKLFNPLNRDVVPIVFGGTDYSRDAPPHSVINAEDFKSPKELADYLKYLDVNDAEYDGYKAWRGTHEVVLQESTVKEAFCRLCQLLHDDNYPVKSYNDLHGWWGKDTKCDRTVLERMKKSWK